MGSRKLAPNKVISKKIASRKMASKNKKARRQSKHGNFNGFMRINLEDLINSAIASKNPDDLKEAEGGLERFLLRDPKSHSALDCLGLVRHYLGDSKKGIKLINKAIGLESNQKLYHLHLGLIYTDIEEWEKAFLAYMEALKIDPAHPQTLLNLGSLCSKRESYPAALQFYHKALDQKPDYLEAHQYLSSIYLKLNQKELALKHLNEYVALAPTDESATHLLSSLRGEEVATASSEYVSGVFDDYAEKFDTHLVEGLRYDAPAKLREAVGRVVGEEMPSWNIMDLGCGTGLVGVQFRDMASHLIGVDLSPKMLEKAKGKNVYEELHHLELTQVLQSRKGDLDLAVSADVLIYVGDLDKVFEECAKALRDGGLFAFTTEAFSGEGYFLRQSGRFAHSVEYIRSLTDKYGFSVVIQEEIILRYESGKPLSGHIFVLSKGEPSAKLTEASSSMDAEHIDEALDKAMAHHEAGHLDEAERIYGEILAIEPENPNALHYLGIIKFQRGHLGEATELIHRAIEQLPDAPSFLNNLGLVLQAQHLWEEAIESLQKALELLPDYEDALNNLGISYKNLGKLEEASDCFERLVELNKGYIEAHNNLGNVYMAQGRVDEAIERYQAAIAQNTEFADAIRNLAKARLQREEHGEAQELFQRLLKLVPGDSEAESGVEACLAATAG